MGVDVHETDLAPEERRGFGAPEYPLGAAVIRDGSVDQSRAVRKQQTLANDAQMMLRLFGREQSRDDASRHRQQRILEPRPDVGRMQQELRRIASRFEEAVPRDCPIADQETIEVAAHGERERGDQLCFVVTARPLQHVGIAHELLI